MKPITAALLLAFSTNVLGDSLDVASIACDTLRDPDTIQLKMDFKSSFLHSSIWVYKEDFHEVVYNANASTLGTDGSDIRRNCRDCCKAVVVRAYSFVVEGESKTSVLTGKFLDSRNASQIELTPKGERWANEPFKSAFRTIDCPKPEEYDTGTREAIFTSYWAHIGDGEGHCTLRHRVYVTYPNGEQIEFDMNLLNDTTLIARIDGQHLIFKRIAKVVQ